jgi:hypothetical protein
MLWAMMIKGRVISLPLYMVLAWNFDLADGPQFLNFAIPFFSLSYCPTALYKCPSWWPGLSDFLAKLMHNSTA